MSYPKPLHWWTDNVLPLVYDESLSYYETMNKIVTYINGITADTVEVKNLVNEIKELVETTGYNTIPQILAKLDELDEAIDDIDEELASDSQTMAQMQGQINTNRNNIATLNTDNTQNKADIATLKTDNTINKGKIATLENDNAQNKADIADLKTDNTQNKTDIADLKTDNAQNKANIADLETDNTQNKADIADLKTDNTQNKNDVADLKDGIEYKAPLPYTLIPVAFTPLSGIITLSLNVQGSVSRYKHTVIDVVEGEHYCVTGVTTDASVTPCAFVYDSTDPSKTKVLLGGENNEGYLNKFIEIPAGYDKLAVNTTLHTSTYPLNVIKTNFMTEDTFINYVYNIPNKITLYKYTEIELDKVVGVVTMSLQVSGAVSRYRHASIPVTPGEKYLVTCYTLNASYPGAFVINSQTDSKAAIINTPNAGVINYEITIPDGFDTLYLNTTYDTPVDTSYYPLTATKVEIPNSEEFSRDYHDKENQINENIFNIKNLERRAKLMDERNPFAWGTFDKPYFIFVHDDSNSFIADTYTAFHAKGVPFGEATIVSYINRTHSGHTVEEWLEMIVNDGGEVLTHWSGDLTDNSPDSMWIEKYVHPKMILEEKGFTVRGTILADASTSRSNKGQMYSELYYDYSDKVGKTPQYNIGRTLLGHFNDLSAFKAQIDADCTINGIHAYGFHGTSTEEWVTETSLEEIIDYIVSKGGVITTYGNVYDLFKSSELEERIKVLESQ